MFVSGIQTNSRLPETCGNFGVFDTTIELASRYGLKMHEFRNTTSPYPINVVFCHDGELFLGEAQIGDGNAAEINRPGKPSDLVALHFRYHGDFQRYRDKLSYEGMPYVYTDLRRLSPIVMDKEVHGWMQQQMSERVDPVEYTVKKIETSEIAPMMLKELAEKMAGLNA